ncbi:predicted protein [Aspergillus terreus NIH2624]|uniref:Uncharacterized protein n=1 Tax=Aspergillus terreus (strain NIH 2624 / FGSC A1156) TaxID=341663 RepID=Q0C9C4_ASPTN|nr:uncharacterized protein ATEG_09710 [Aspergillus terreus NIH2624]EAU29901.1 predicted protein [Aspergillus terreus NIH2624]
MCGFIHAISLHYLPSKTSDSSTSVNAICPNPSLILDGVYVPPRLCIPIPLPSLYRQNVPQPYCTCDHPQVRIFASPLVTSFISTEIAFSGIVIDRDAIKSAKSKRDKLCKFGQATGLTVGRYTGWKSVHVATGMGNGNEIMIEIHEHWFTFWSTPEESLKDRGLSRMVGEYASPMSTHEQCTMHSIWATA